LPPAFVEMLRDRRGAAAAEIERKHQACRVGLLLHRLQNDACLYRHRAIDGVDLFDLVQPLERNDDVVRRRQRTADEPGQSAVCNDALPLCMTDRQRSADPGGITRPYQCLRADAFAAPYA
jgi:hypothetical protein